MGRNNGKALPYGFHEDDLGFLTVIDTNATRHYKTFVSENGSYKEIEPNGVNPIAWRFPPYYLREVYFDRMREGKTPDVIGVYATRNGASEIFSGFRYRHADHQPNGRGKKPEVEFLKRAELRQFI